MRVLVTGAGGQVGAELVRRARAPLVLDARDSHALDITDRAAVRLAVAGADLVINAAAYTAVDSAEREPERAFAVNRDGVAHLADACAAGGIPLFHISTDYVFDGRAGRAWREDDVPAPLGVYGASKLAGEKVLRERLDRHLVLRVSWVFGALGSNFVRTILRLAAEREELRVVADQVGGPTPADAIADSLLALAVRFGQGGALARGTYHYCGTPAVSWHGFAEAIVAEARRRMPLRVQRVTPITSAEFPTPAARPANSRLDCGRLRADHGIEQPRWDAGLRRVLDECDDIRATG